VEVIKVLKSKTMECAIYIYTISAADLFVSTQLTLVTGTKYSAPLIPKPTTETNLVPVQ
jgi:hypothetical protein